MPDDLPSHFIDLVQDAVLKSFWRKNALLAFLRRHKISDAFLAGWQETETKRIFIGRLLPKLEAHAKGSQILKQMAVSLAEQTKFPDLEGWEDTKQKVDAAKEAVQSLRHYLDTQKQKAEELKEREEIKQLARRRLQDEVLPKNRTSGLNRKHTGK